MDLTAAAEGTLCRTSWEVSTLLRAHQRVGRSLSLFLTAQTLNRFTTSVSWSEPGRTDTDAPKDYYLSVIYADLYITYIQTSIQPHAGVLRGGWDISCQCSRWVSICVYVYVYVYTVAQKGSDFTLTLYNSPHFGVLTNVYHWCRCIRKLSLCLCHRPGSGEENDPHMTGSEGTVHNWLVSTSSSFCYSGWTAQAFVQHDVIQTARHPRVK